MRNWFAVIGACAALTLGSLATSVAADTITYTYDVFGRVLTATYSSGVTVTYAYDNAGNRTSQVTSTGGGGGGTPSPFAASVSRTNYSEDFTFGAFSDPIVVTASGGTGPYTYTWTKVSGGSGIFTVPNANGSSMDFNATHGNNDFTSYSFSGVWSVTVTDTAGHSAAFPINVSITVDCTQC